jgi:hypothetical protein
MTASFMQAVLSYSMLAAVVAPGTPFFDMLQSVWMQPRDWQPLYAAYHGP